VFGAIYVGTFILSMSGQSTTMALTDNTTRNETEKNKDARVHSGSGDVMDDGIPGR
jgi:hypothetical protein